MTTAETLTPPAGVDGPQPAANSGGKQPWVRRHPAATTVITVGALVAGTLGIAAIVGAVQHGSASDAYTAAHTTAARLVTTDKEAQAAFAAEHSVTTALAGKLKTIESASAGYLDPAARTVISAQLANLAMYNGFTAGQKASSPDATVGANASTEQLEHAASALTRQIQAEHAQLAKTSKAARGLAGQVAATQIALTGIITGSKATPTTKAVTGLASTAKILLAKYAKAAGPVKVAFQASVTTAVTAAAVHGTILDPLTDYLAKAKALHDAHDATVAAQAAAAAAAAANEGQDTHPTTGAINSTPNYGGGGSGSSSGGDSSSSSSGGGGSSSGGSSSSGGGGAPAVDHTPHVNAGGNYQPGCNGGFAYSQETSSGGTVVISVPYPYTYSTYSTPDGFGVNVYNCA